MRDAFAQRNLPPLMERRGERAAGPDAWRARRKELLEVLAREEFGRTPNAPETVNSETAKRMPLLGGKAVYETVRVSFDAPLGPCAFEFEMILPAGPGPHPVFLRLGFGPLPDYGTPLEEIVDRGFGFVNLPVANVTSDSGERDGIAALYGAAPGDGWGKIGMWAFGASRVMDCLETRPEIDPRRVAVAGHSRLGKTALWCGAQDERFCLVIAAQSGCAGAAISRGKGGESIEAITRRFPYWFCENYAGWADRESEAPFDQHFLLALCAPRRLYVSSASEDAWADPASEYLGCLAAEPAWAVYGMPGVTPDAFTGEPDLTLPDGAIAYHIRPGTHYLGRTDWLRYMAYRERTEK